MMMPTITPNSPSALPKISTTRILTKSEEFCASESAQLLPTIPTHILQRQQRDRQKVVVELVAVHGHRLERMAALLISQKPGLAWHAVT